MSKESIFIGKIICSVIGKIICSVIGIFLIIYAIAVVFGFILLSGLGGSLWHYGWFIPIISFIVGIAFVFVSITPEDSNVIHTGDLVRYNGEVFKVEKRFKDKLAIWSLLTETGQLVDIKDVEKIN